MLFYRRVSHDAPCAAFDDHRKTENQLLKSAYLNIQQVRETEKNVATVKKIIFFLKSFNNTEIQQQTCH